MTAAKKITIRYKTCVSVNESTPAAMRKTIVRALKKSEYAEARLDYINPTDTITSIKKDVKALLDSLDKEQLRRRVICTVRAKQDGGVFKHAEEQRHGLLKMICAYMPYRIDVELDSLQKDKGLADDLAASGASILASWHSFDHMPSAGVMHKKLQSMLKYTTHLKIACMAQNTTESIRMLGLYRWLATDVNQKLKNINRNSSSSSNSSNGTRRNKATLISFAMGNPGQMTRILCMHLGSPYTYVSLNEAVAPGQLSLADVKSMEKTFCRN